jgi:hypothetical protein
VHDATTQKLKFELDVADYELTPGLYYWKLENDEEIVYLGKFYVEKKTD